MSGNHVRQPCPATISAKILRVHIAPPSNVQFVRSSMRLSCHLPPASSSMPLSIPPSVPLPMPLLRRHPFCRLAYTVLFIVHAIRVPSCKPGFKHGRPPCPRCRRILLVSLLFHHCLTPLLSFIRPHDQSYRPYMEHLASSPAAPSAANIYTHLNDAHILHAKDKIESVFAPEMELAHENKVAQKLHKPETIPYEQNKKASKSQ